MRDFKNIIFDFGGVIIDIDYLLTIEAFKKLGIKDFETYYSKLKQSNLFDELETGIITAAEFRNRIRESAKLSVSDSEIDAAWNSILIDLPEANVNFLDHLKNNYPIFLLSNTNEIHEQAFNEMIQKKFGEDVLKKIFRNIYFSHHIKLRKPDPEIFLYVLKENNLVASETLFVDDSPQHIEGAKKVGLQTFYFDKGKKLADILNK
jgi:HAD superfamily hydrolase (TIGR01549 family)